MFAVVGIAPGVVVSECEPDQATYKEFLAFLRRLDACILLELDVHLIVDNYATHNHPEVRTSLALRLSYHSHYMRSYCGSSK